MTIQAKRQMRPINSSINKGALVNTVKILSDITRKDIEKSYNFSEAQSARTHRSNRHVKL